MTRDAWISLLVKVLLMILTPLAAQLHINDGASLTAIATDIADLIVLGYGVWSHYGMDKVKAVVQILIVAFLLSIFLAPRTFAADVAGKTPAAPFGKYPYDVSGLYVGLYAEGGGGSVAASVPGVGPASLTTTQASIGLTVGYGWARSGSAIAYALEGDVCASNFNGNNAGLSLSGPLCFEQRFVIFAPWDKIMGAIANIPNPFNAVPPFQPLQPGVTASNRQMGIAVGAYERDISTAFAGVAANKVWRIEPEIAFIVMDQLSNGTAVRAFLKLSFPDKGTIFGPVKNASAVLGPEIRAGVGSYF